MKTTDVMKKAEKKSSRLNLGIVVMVILILSMVMLISAVSDSQELDSMTMQGEKKDTDIPADDKSVTSSVVRDGTRNGQRDGIRNGQRDTVRGTLSMPGGSDAHNDSAVAR